MSEIAARPGEGRSTDRIVFLCDFDGTITQEDTSHVILNHFTGERWIPVNDAWRRFEITTEERVRAQFGLFTATEEALREVVGAVPIDPYFPEFARWCREKGHELRIVSDGFDFCIDLILSRHGLADLDSVSNHLSFRDGALALAFAHQNPACRMCGNCKWWVSREVKRRGGRIAYIGDGLSDRGGAALADWIFAKSLLADYCSANQIPFIPYDSFADVLMAARDEGLERLPSPRWEERAPGGKLPCQEGRSPSEPA